MRKITNPELGRPTPEKFALQAKNPLVVVLDNLRSAHNVGSFFRTADAFAAERIVLCGITAAPPDREIHKTALGAELTIPWQYEADTVSAVRKLQSEGYSVLAAEQVEGAAMLNGWRTEPGQKYAVVFGNEVNGIGQEAVDACDGALEIPQAGTKHSLNVAVSGGVVLWEFFRQWQR